MRVNYPDSHANLERLGPKWLEPWENEDPEHRMVFYQAQGDISNHMPDVTISYRFNKKQPYEMLAIIEYTCLLTQTVNDMWKKEEKYAESHPGIPLIHIWQESQGVEMMQQLAEILAEAKSKRYNKRYVAAKAA